MAEKKESKVSRKEVKSEYAIPLRQITALSNEINKTRYPLSDAALAAGYGIFTPVEGSDKPALWPLAVSENVEERVKYKDIIDTLDPGMANFARNLLAVGQLQPIVVKSKGKNAAGVETYTLVSGNRRCFAQLYLFACGLLQTKEPVLNGTLFDGNSADVAVATWSADFYTQALRPTEIANCYKVQLNSGLSIEELAAKEGCSVSTINNRLELLKLEPADQKRVDNKEITQVEARNIVRAAEGKKPIQAPKKAPAAPVVIPANNPYGTPGAAVPAAIPSPKGGVLRSYKEVYERWESTPYNWERVALAWVLQLKWTPEVSEDGLEVEFQQTLTGQDIEELENAREDAKEAALAD